MYLLIYVLKENTRSIDDRPLVAIGCCVVLQCVQHLNLVTSHIIYGPHPSKNTNRLHPRSEEPVHKDLEFDGVQAFTKVPMLFPWIRGYVQQLQYI